MRYGSIALALCLGGALTVGLLLLIPHAVQSAPPNSCASLQEEVYYNRTQTVTLQAPSLHEMYATAFTTTFQIHIRDYTLPDWIRLPSDVVIRRVYCQDNASCGVVYGEIAGTPVVTFTGTGKATIYLEYDTQSKAWRDPGARTINLSYPVGPDYPEMALTHTIVFSRSINPPWQLGSPISPSGYIHDHTAHTLKWVFTSTRWLRFTATFTEPLLGSDLVIDSLEMNPEEPAVGQMVYYTAVVRNQGNCGTGRSVLAEVLVRPYALGPPVVLTDHVGGWSWTDENGLPRGYGEDALFNWYFPAPYQIYLPLVVRAYRVGSAAAPVGAQVLLPGSYWWPGLEPSHVTTGVASFPWPEDCGTQMCGVWAKVDPAYMDVGVVYEWWGYNPEGLDCGLGEDHLPTCQEERNNIASAFTRFLIYLPLTLRANP